MGIYKIKEIRWFFRKGNKHIRDWFDNLEFFDFEKREDVYINLKQDDVGIKLREGNIEIKHSVRTRVKGCEVSMGIGYLSKTSVGQY